jgi:CcmD family protein
MSYLFAAYAVFWVLTFALVFSVFSRQRAVERDLERLRAVMQDRSREADKNS